MKERTAIIYAWICPITSDVVYIGKTSVGISTRMVSHRRTAIKKATTRSHLWLRDIISQGLFPEILELQKCSTFDSSSCERMWIAHYKEKGCDLLNISDGGTGNPGIGRVKWTPELESKLGKVFDDVIAQEVGCCVATISYKRRNLGIPRCPDKQTYGGFVLPEIILSQAIIDRIGLEPDYLIARDIGASKFVIRQYRQRHNIKSYAESTGNNGRASAGNVIAKTHNFPPEIIKQLGVVPDYLIGAQLGFDKFVIARIRRKLNIKATRAPKGAAALHIYENSDTGKAEVLI